MLKVENLTKLFTIHSSGKKLIRALEDVSFFLPYGVSLGVCGPNGSGKSSLLKCIYRTYLPSYGNIWYESSLFGKVNLSTLDEQRVTKIREREIGYVSQFLKVPPRVSALDLVREPMILNGMKKEDADSLARELLRRLEIPEKLFDAYPWTFSGGEQQRINIARAIAKGPRLLLLDEPTSSLDRRSKASLLEILEELKRDGCTMIGVFHEEDLLKRFSDEILDLGRFVRG